MTGTTPHKTIGLYANPLMAKADLVTSKSSPRTLVGRALAKFTSAVAWRANSRDADYMSRLFAQNYPDGVLLDMQQDSWRNQVSDAERVVLLYPDSIGIGWGVLEAQVASALPTSAELRVINGRGRDFTLDAPTWVSLAARRALERTMLPELALTPLILVSTPPLLIYDWLRGRR